MEQGSVDRVAVPVEEGGTLDLSSGWPTERSRMFWPGSSQVPILLVIVILKESDRETFNEGTSASTGFLGWGKATNSEVGSPGSSCPRLVPQNNTCSEIFFQGRHVDYKAFFTGGAGCSHELVSGPFWPRGGLWMRSIAQLLDAHSISLKTLPLVLSASGHCSWHKFPWLSRACRNKY